MNERQEQPEVPILYHDPTSEPSRAVHWLALAADIPLVLRYTWLTRGEHLQPELLAVNPRHQVPALRHGAFTLSESVAIMMYLVELAGVGDEWVGSDLRMRARTHMLLSWYHLALRKKLTLDYFLKVLLAPGYLGEPSPEETERRELQAAVQETLTETTALLGDAPFFNGRRPTLADLMFATDVEALACDPAREELLRPFASLRAWLDRMQAVQGYADAHRAWHHVAPLVRARLLDPARSPTGPGWVADACERVLPPGSTQAQ